MGRRRRPAADPVGRIDAIRGAEWSTYSDAGCRHAQAPSASVAFSALMPWQNDVWRIRTREAVSWSMVIGSAVGMCEP